MFYNKNQQVEEENKKLFIPPISKLTLGQQF